MPALGGVVQHGTGHTVKVFVSRMAAPILTHQLPICSKSLLAAVASC